MHYDNLIVAIALTVIAPWVLKSWGTWPAVAVIGIAIGNIVCGVME